MLSRRLIPAAPPLLMPSMTAGGKIEWASPRKWPNSWVRMVCRSSAFAGDGGLWTDQSLQVFMMMVGCPLTDVADALMVCEQAMLPGKSGIGWNTMLTVGLLVTSVNDKF